MKSSKLTSFPPPWPSSRRSVQRPNNYLPSSFRRRPSSYSNAAALIRSGPINPLQETFMRHLLFAMLCISCLQAGAQSAGPADPPEHEMATHDDVQIEVTAQGRGPLVVILPSLGRSGRDYDHVAALLAWAGFRVLRPEPRGIGLSRGPLDNLSLHDFAADVAAVIEHEHHGPAVVVGHAWGNFPARMLATDRPDLVQGLVLVGASAGKVPAGSSELPISPAMRQAIDGAGDTRLSEAQRLAYLRLAFFAPGHDPRVWLDGWYPVTHQAEGHARNITTV